MTQIKDLKDNKKPLTLKDKIGWGIAAGGLALSIGGIFTGIGIDVYNSIKNENASKVYKMESKLSKLKNELSNYQNEYSKRKDLVDKMEVEYITLKQPTIEEIKDYKTIGNLTKYIIPGSFFGIPITILGLAYIIKNSERNKEVEKCENH